MEWTKSQLLHDSQTVSFDEDVEIDRTVFEKNSRIDSAEDVHVDGTGYLDSDGDRFYVNLHITGIMVCPDAITGELIDVPFETESSETYVFEESDEDGVRIVTNEVIEILPAVIDDILLEVPLQVTEAAEGEYPEGDGWKIYTEAEYQESQKDQIDPRLAKLKQFNEEQ